MLSTRTENIPQRASHCPKSILCELLAILIVPLIPLLWIFFHCSNFHSTAAHLITSRISNSTQSILSQKIPALDAGPPKCLWRPCQVQFDLRWYFQASNVLIIFLQTIVLGFLGLSLTLATVYLQRLHVSLRVSLRVPPCVPPCVPSCVPPCVSLSVHPYVICVSLRVSFVCHLCVLPCLPPLCGASPR